jgi:hypothetical protein
LMEDLEVAKRLISTIIDEQILDLEVMPQEFTSFYQKFGISILRLDFKAVIQTETGEVKKVLIELQKSKNALDVRRFRRYLGENYLKTDTVAGKRESLPIITIYFLGFELAVKVPILHINRIYTDRVTGRQVQGKDEFIEKLTHDSFVIQIPHLPTLTQTKVEKILSVFNQKWVIDQDNRLMMSINDILIDDKDVELIIKRLEQAAQDRQTREQAEMEADMEDGLDQKFLEKDTKIENLENKLVKAQQLAEAQAEEVRKAQQLAETQAQEIEKLRQQLAKMNK